MVKGDRTRGADEREKVEHLNGKFSKKWWWGKEKRRGRDRKRRMFKTETEGGG